MSELQSLLVQAREEILSLRRRNELLEAKVEMIDLFACVLHSQPARQSQGAGLDLAWALQKKIDELNAPTAASTNHTDRNAGGES